MAYFNEIDPQLELRFDTAISIGQGDGTNCLGSYIQVNFVQQSFVRLIVEEMCFICYDGFSQLSASNTLIFLKAIHFLPSRLWS